MRDVSARAKELFTTTGFYCAESVLLAVAEQINIKNEVIPRIATGFCSGMARTGGTCGAVSGGIMAISMVLGINQPGEDRDICYQAVQQFMGRFSQRFGAFTCLELTGVQLGTPEGQLAFKEKGLISNCAEYVGEAAQMVVEVLPNDSN